MAETLETAPLEFTPDSGLDQGAGADGMIRLLRTAVADSYVVLVKTQVTHWDASGAAFYSIHKLTETQYEDLFDAIDTLAERIRALGGRPAETLKQLAAESSVPDASPTASTRTLLEGLIADHDHVSSGMRRAVDAADAISDHVTADLLTGRIAFHEKAAWMLRAVAA
ncbi:MAG: DNA starvation/stationary phase protection protein [Alphaproteobacteria bacterium]|nr:DNA starvation/stationary phase protection protein [Alphaproteobacteria bacterium]